MQNQPAIILDDSRQRENKEKDVISLKKLHSKERDAKSNGFQKLKIDDKENKIKVTLSKGRIV